MAGAPTLLLTGDVSFLHDLGALVGARLRRGLTIVVVDNDGGGIFSFLAQATAERPVSGLPERFEQLFGTPHGVPIASVGVALGRRHGRSTSEPACRPGEAVATVAGRTTAGAAVGPGPERGAAPRRGPGRVGSAAARRIERRATRVTP